MSEKLSHPKARDAAIKEYEWWIAYGVTKEEAFDHAIARYLIGRKIELPKDF